MDDRRWKSTHRPSSVSHSSFLFHKIELELKITSYTISIYIHVIHANGILNNIHLLS